MLAAGSAGRICLPGQVARVNGKPAGSFESYDGLIGEICRNLFLKLELTRPRGELRRVVRKDDVVCINRNLLSEPFG